MDISIELMLWVFGGLSTTIGALLVYIFLDLKRSMTDMRITQVRMEAKMDQYELCNTAEHNEVNIRLAVMEGSISSLQAEIARLLARDAD